MVKLRRIPRTISCPIRQSFDLKIASAITSHQDGDEYVNSVMQCSSSILTNNADIDMSQGTNTCYAFKLGFDVSYIDS